MKLFDVLDRRAKAIFFSKWGIAGCLIKVLFSRINSTLSLVL